MPEKRLRWYCHPRPDDMPPAAVTGGVAVIIDVLRASTTIVTALAEGAAFVLPTAQISAARHFQRDLPPGTLLGGERGGKPIAGFDLGNSPAEYCRSQVAGRGIVMTTTNGTVALARCQQAREALIGCLVNRTAVAMLAARLADEATGVHLVCAGTDGQVTEEDLLGAGAILDAAVSDSVCGVPLLDSAGEHALEAFRRLTTGVTDQVASLVDAFTRAAGGMNLVRIGMAADLSFAATVDRFNLVPQRCTETGRLLLR